LKLPEALNFSWDDQIFVPAQGNAVLGGKALRSLRDEIHMRAIAQNFARRPDRISEVFDTSHAPSPQGTAVHDQSIQLDFPFPVKEAATAGVKGFVIFEDHNCFFDRIQRGTSSAQY
jgi:hypothetical protein